MCHCIYITLFLIDTSDDRETIELVCPDPVFDPESAMYNVSVMWNITNPLLSEGVGAYFLRLEKISGSDFLLIFQHVSLRPEVRTMNTVLC